MPVSKKSSQSNELEPYWQSDCGRATIYVGDNLQVMMHLAANQFHAVVTDPPYGIEFMGKEWDAPWKNDGKIEMCDEGTDKSHPFRDGTQRVVYGNKKTHARQHRAAEMDDPVKAKYLRHNVEYVRDSAVYQQWFWDRANMILRVAKPGAHLLSFGGTRMFHRMACAIEDAGFEIRDVIMWVYGSGFPKSMDVSKAIDKHLGAEPTKVAEVNHEGLGGQFKSRDGVEGGYGYGSNWNLTTPTTDEAKQWDGWGTCLKPAYEPIVWARKPLTGSVAENTLEHGCGGVNVDGCRVGEREGIQVTGAKTTSNCYGNIDVPGGKLLPPGRWPANFVHDGSDEVVESFPQTVPAKRSVRSKEDKGNKIYGQYGDKFVIGGYDDDGGSAARFFYSAKANDSDRAFGSKAIHPTVKPLDLMRYLVRLVCMKGGTVLDPFMGSGSTGCACIEEGMYFVGIEKSEEYAQIAVDRFKEMLGVHPIVSRLKSGKRVVVDTPPAPKKLR